MSTTTHKPSLPAELRQGGSMRARELVEALSEWDPNTFVRVELGPGPLTSTVLPVPASVARWAWLPRASSSTTTMTMTTTTTT